MAPDSPKFRPTERFWPYADLPEQPTDEELASLDPDLQEALFGAKPRPFSITLVFPTLEFPSSDGLWSSHEPRRNIGRPVQVQRFAIEHGSGRPMPPASATCSRSSDGRIQQRS